MFKFLVRGLTIFIIATVIFMICRIYREANVEDRQHINQIPVFSLDSNSFFIDFNEKDTTIVLLFNSECNICLIELEEYKKLPHQFKHYRIILLSFQSISELRKAHKEHELSTYNNIEIYKLIYENIPPAIKSAPNPSSFVFNHKGKLIFENKGYLKPEILINEIRK